MVLQVPEKCCHALVGLGSFGFSLSVSCSQVCADGVSFIAQLWADHSSSLRSSTGLALDWFVKLQ